MDLPAPEGPMMPMKSPLVHAERDVAERLLGLRAIENETSSTLMIVSMDTFHSHWGQS